MAEEKKQIKIDNTALVEAIQQLKAEQSEENFNRVGRLIQTGQYICPVKVIENTEAVEKEDGKVALENKRSFRFNVLSNKDGKKYMPVFTSREEVAKGDQEIFNDEQYLVMNVVTLMSAFAKKENDEAIEGIVIDPFSNNFAVPKSILRTMAESEVFTPKPNEQVKVYPPDKFPDGFLDAVREALDEDGRVNQLFVLVLERQNTAKSLVIIVDDEEKLPLDERRELFQKITESVAKFTKGMRLMLVPFSDGFAQQVTNNRLPCYRR